MFLCVFSGTGRVEAGGKTAGLEAGMAVVLPADTREVAAIVKLCNRLGVPFIARGAGTNLSGGTIPHPGGVVVPGSSLLQMISTNELWISAWVDETAMARLATGEVARVVASPAFQEKLGNLGVTPATQPADMDALLKLARKEQCLALGTRLRARSSSLALIATMTVLRDISAAPAAGESTTPQAYAAPAASGMANAL